MRCLFPSEKGEDEQQYHGAGGAHEELAPPGVTHRETELAEDPAAQEAADKTDDDANQKAHAFAHDAAGDEARQRADKDRYDDTPHSVLDLMVSIID